AHEAGIFPHHDEASGIAERKRLQQYRVYQAENCRVCANTKRQREYRKDREPRTLAKHAQSETKVLNQRHCLVSGNCEATSLRGKLDEPAKSRKEPAAERVRSRD